jgi:hypothetical protein
VALTGSHNYDCRFIVHLLDRAQVHLFTQLETATLFYSRSSDLYLEDNGIMAFVMPRSVLTGALHHANFKRFKKPKMKLVKIYDLEDVTPLFNVPSCVLIAVKGEETSYPVLARKYSGRLPEKNVRLDEAIKRFSASDYMYEAPEIPTGYSHYHDYIKAGAAIYPRCFYFIEFDVHPIFGIDTMKPLVKTSEEVMNDAKRPRKDIRLSGNIESEFIYATLLGGDVLPFGYVKFRPVIVPIEPHLTGYHLLNTNILRGRGFPHMANWLAKAQKIWEGHRTKKSEKRFPHVLDSLDYNGLLSGQKPTKVFVLLYNTAGTNISSCVIDKQRLRPFSVSKVTISPKSFIAETMTMFYETDDELEAHYLCAVINSNIINEAIKPLQTKGLFGERHIMRRPFMFPILAFNEKNPLHLELAKLSKQCHAKVSSIRFTKRSTAGLRKEAREAVEKEIAEIDKLLSQLLGL